jgi:hypothetical protein
LAFAEPSPAGKRPAGRPVGEFTLDEWRHFLAGGMQGNSDGVVGAEDR